MFKSFPKIDKNEVNPLENFSCNNFSGKKSISISPAYKLIDLKRIYKKFNGGTLNDLCLCLISRALESWKRDRKEECKSITGIFGVNIRTTIEPTELGNYSQGRIINLRSSENFNESMESIIKSTTELKRKEMLIASLPLMTAISKYLMNEDLLMKSFGDMNKKIPFIFTNVQGPKDHVILKNTEAKVNDIFVIVPHGSLSFSIVLFSYAGEIRFAFNTDRASETPIDQFCNYLAKEIEENLKLII